MLISKPNHNWCYTVAASFILFSLLAPTATADDHRLPPSAYQNQPENPPLPDKVKNERIFRENQESERRRQANEDANSGRDSRRASPGSDGPVHSTDVKEPSLFDRVNKKTRERMGTRSAK